jgi:hypothetical protein
MFANPKMFEPQRHREHREKKIEETEGRIPTRCEFTGFGSRFLGLSSL